MSRGKLIIISLLAAVVFPTSCNASKNGIDKVEPTHPIEAESYTIQFKWHDGESTPETVSRGNMPTIPSNPSNYEDDGYTYTFSSWSPAVSIATEDKVYNAIYTCTAKEFNITFDADNGAELNVQKLKYGEYPSIPENPKKDDSGDKHYIFSHWEPEINRVTNNQTYTAKYTETSLSDAKISIECVNCSINGRTLINEVKKVGSAVSYQFSLLSDYQVHDAPYKIDLSVEGIDKPIYTYNEETATLTFNVQGNTTIIAEADNCAAKFVYNYNPDLDPEYHTFGFAYIGELDKVDWGDGSIDKLSEHTYSGDESKTYTIRIFGNIVSFNNDTKHAKAHESVLKAYLYHSTITLFAEAFADWGMEEIFISKDVEIINNDAFKSAKIKHVIFERGSKIRTINYNTFYNCSSLISINIPAGVSSISHSAFYNCSSLKTVTFEEGSKLSSISVSAFYNCKSLSSIVIPNSVTSIGDNAFYNCSSLTSINIPSAVTSIGYSAFDDCSSLKTVTFEEGSKLTSLRFQAFSSCDVLESINLENTKISEIPFNCFFGCHKLTSIKIPSSVVSIAQTAFINCTSLVSIIIPSNVTSIGDNAFDGCSSLKTVTFEENSKLTSLGKDAFYKCSSLESINLEITKISTIPNYCFAGCKLISIKFPNTLTSIGEHAFDSCSSLKTILFGENSKLKSLGFAAFAECTSLTSISIPNSIISIDEPIFQSCSSLQTVKFEEGCQLELLPPQAFYLRSALESINLEVTKISSVPYMCFYGCNKLSSVKVPSTVTSFEYNAFQQCPSLSILDLSNVNQVILGYNSLFAGSDAIEKIIVPADLVDSYKTAQYWSSYADKIVPAE